MKRVFSIINKYHKMETDIVVCDLYNCRFCLCETVEPRNMMEDDAFLEKCSEIFHKLSINISPDNGLPVIACEYCFNFINQFYTFYESVKENQDHLVNCFIKIEENNDNLDTRIEDVPSIEVKDVKKSKQPSQKKENYVITPQMIQKYKNGDIINSHLKLTLKGKSIYICDSCDKYFTNKTHLNTHVMKCSISSQSLKPTSDRPSYRKVPKPQELVVSCPICPPHALKFKNHEILRLHMTEHDRFDRIEQSRSERGLDSLIQCPNCERRFSNYEEFETHLKNHENRRFMTCELCGRSIVTSSLKTHLKLHFKRFCCEFCSHRFRNRCDLTKHIRLNHERPDRYECNYCMKKIRHRTALEKHLEFCRGPGTVGPCVHCGQQFASKSDRMYHVQKYHTGYVCRTCNVELEGVTALKNHRKSESHKKARVEAQIRKEQIKQEKLLKKKAPLRKVTFGIDLI